jgi:hypothetical protein
LKYKLCIFPVLFAILFQVNAQPADSADFSWGNGFYFNLNVGESITFNQSEVKLLKTENHYNQLKVGEDTIWLKVARRSVPEELNDVRVFVADNKRVKALSAGSEVHGLLTKDALVCLSDARFLLLDPVQYAFPVSFNDGFMWSAEEDSYPFSFYKTDQAQNSYISYPGIGFNLHDARGRKKHWLVAVENSRVIWVENRGEGDGNQACVLLESESQPGIYYVYNRLFTKNVAVKKGQKLFRGDAIGTAWGDESWGHLQFVVIHSKSEPTFEECFNNSVNVFPHLFGLYFQQGRFMARTFTRGKIVFGNPRALSGNQLNTHEFENYSGKGWITGKWNPAGKVEWVAKGNEGNVRLKKVLFEDTPAQTGNPEDYFEYQITVRNGTYRIRAKVGDVYLPTWQKIEFEGVTAATKSLEAGEFDWTGERIVKVTDGSLTVRIYIDHENKLAAGLSEIVFQQAQSF